MKRWILILLVGIALFYIITLREGAGGSLTPTPTCKSGSTFDGKNCLDSKKIISTPTCPAGYYFSTDKCVAGTPPARDPTKYSDVISETQDRNVGPLPTAIDERSSTRDAGTLRPMNGPVFGDNGPFSGQSGTGRGTGMDAASTLKGNSYGTSGIGNVSLSAYDFWPGTKGSSKAAPPGRTIPVNGPQWGGPGKPASGSSAASSRPAPALYGPGDGGKLEGSELGSSKKNSMDVTMLPGFQSTGSDPSNQYAGTSRAPGDQDIYAPPYSQSTSYSLANGSQKTEPVPYLTDFSAFQN